MKYNMGNRTLIKALLVILAVVTLITIVMLVLVGKNGLIQQELDEYNSTHIEENSERQNNKK